MIDEGSSLLVKNSSVTLPVSTFVILVWNGSYSNVSLRSARVGLRDDLMRGVVFVDGFAAPAISQFRELMRAVVFELPPQPASAG